ncbi:hypothetical protein [Methylomagnum ishizawai]|uniref:hypothetical protein n=1 Tax=Methylomagnum ishizawai TaxID=1760988 RepID=UPI001C32D8A4|nr:hypothetical protein [Methylomagnum ishizawai]BBL76884.1 hypothetical protein MishRS11D_39820 [Methylomagnum ishizawai]
MSKKIDKGSDDKTAGIRFHISSARMAIGKLSYVAFQRYLDEMERSMYLCPECGWRGRGKELVPMERDDGDAYSIEHEGDCWYACPKCEAEVPVERPVMRAAPGGNPGG